MFSRRKTTFLFEINLSEKEINKGYKYETKANYSRFKRNLRTLFLSLPLSLSLARWLARSLAIGTKLITINSFQLIMRVPETAGSQTAPWIDLPHPPLSKIFFPYDIRNSKGRGLESVDA